MAASLKLARIIHAAFIASAVLYVVIAETLEHRQAAPDLRPVYLVLLGVATLCAATAFVLRWKFVTGSEELLRSNPQDGATIQRWRAGQIVSLALAEAIVLFGFVLRFLGARFGESAAFYVLGFVLLLGFWPKRP